MCALCYYAQECQWLCICLLVKSQAFIVYVCVRMFQTILHPAGVSSAGVFADPSTPKQSVLSRRREPELNAKTLKNTPFICCDGLSQSSMLQSQC